ncbi:MAG: hypothetical protein MHM6MM_005710 [Cercozoa sp. M6MM]
MSSPDAASAARIQELRSNARARLQARQAILSRVLATGGQFTKFHQRKKQLKKKNNSAPRRVFVSSDERVCWADSEHTSSVPCAELHQVIPDESDARRFLLKFASRTLDLQLPNAAAERKSLESLQDAIEKEGESAKEAGEELVQECAGDGRKVWLVAFGDLVRRVAGDSISAPSKVRHAMSLSADMKWSGDDFAVGAGVELGDVLGRGAYGEVRRCRFAGNDCAAKVVELRDGSDQKRRIDALRTEMEILRGLQHERVVRYFGCVQLPKTTLSQETAPPGRPPLHPDSSRVEESSERLLVLMELMRYGSLPTQRMLRGAGAESYAPEDIQVLARALLEGLAYMHENKVAHGDIKADNVLVSDDGIKLADFGIASHLADNSTGKVRRIAGTPLFMAPEQLAHQADFDRFACDMFAFGCMLCELVDGAPPHAHLRSMEEVRAVRSQKTCTIAPSSTPETAFPEASAKNPKLVQKLYDSMCDLISKCCEYDAAKRPTAQQVLDSHPFVADEAVRNPLCSRLVMAQVISRVARLREPSAGMSNKKHSRKTSSLGRLFNKLRRSTQHEVPASVPEPATQQSTVGTTATLQESLNHSAFLRNSGQTPAQKRASDKSDKTSERGEGKSRGSAKSSMRTSQEALPDNERTHARQESNVSARKFFDLDFATFSNHGDGERMRDLDTERRASNEASLTVRRSATVREMTHPALPEESEEGVHEQRHRHLVRTRRARSWDAQVSADFRRSAPAQLIEHTVNLEEQHKELLEEVEELRSELQKLQELSETKQALLLQEQEVELTTNELRQSEENLQQMTQLYEHIAAMETQLTDTSEEAFELRKRVQSQQLQLQHGELDRVQNEVQLKVLSVSLNDAEKQLHVARNEVDALKCAQGASIQRLQEKERYAEQLQHELTSLSHALAEAKSLSARRSSRHDKTIVRLRQQAQTLEQSNRSLRNVLDALVEQAEQRQREQAAQRQARLATASVQTVEQHVEQLLQHQSESTCREERIPMLPLIAVAIACVLVLLLLPANIPTSEPNFGSF